jgi:hypothetical protein
LDENGNESEAVGAQFCENLFGGLWLQTSFNGRIRKNFASPGMFYYPEQDVFAWSPPETWYMLNGHFEWEVPIGIHPDTGVPLEDWQWEYLEVAFALQPDYSSLAPNSQN